MAADAAFLASCNNAKGYPRLLAARAGHDAYDRLERITAETLVFSGSTDQQAPPACGEVLARHIPGAAFFAFDGGHGFTFSGLKPVETILAHWR